MEGRPAEASQQTTFCFFLFVLYVSLLTRALSSPQLEHLMASRSSPRWWAAMWLPMA